MADRLFLLFFGTLRSIYVFSTLCKDSNFAHVWYNRNEHILRAPRHSMACYFAFAKVFVEELFLSNEFLYGSKTLPNVIRAISFHTQGNQSTFSSTNREYLDENQNSIHITGEH